MPPYPGVYRLSGLFLHPRRTSSFEGGPLMQPSYETVIFDKDGTLIDSAPGIMRAIRYTLEGLHLPVPEVLDPRVLIGPPLKLVYAQGLGIDDDRIDRAVDLHREYYGRYGVYEAELYPGILDLLRELHALGVKVCVATSKFHTMAQLMLDHFGLTPYLHYAAMSDGTERTSSKAALLASVLEHCGSLPEQAVMVGDTIYDAEGARDTGTPFVGVLFGYGVRQQMESAGARHFAADTNELRRCLFFRSSGGNDASAGGPAFAPPCRSKR